MKDGKYLAKPQIFGPERHPVFARYEHNFEYNIFFNAFGSVNITFAETNPIAISSSWRIEASDERSFVWYTLLAERFDIPIIETTNTDLTTTLHIRILDTETRWVFNNPDLRIEYAHNEANTEDSMSLFINISNFTMRWNIIFSDPFSGGSDFVFDE